MKRIIITLILQLYFFFCFCQDNPTPSGYKLSKSQEIVFVYRDDNGKPDLSVWNKWSYKYWFIVDNQIANYTDPTTKVVYIRITIPAKKRWDDLKNDWTTDIDYSTKVNWKNGEFIDASDFNTWIWIRKDVFDSYKLNYYGKISGLFVLSGLTVPFKYHPSLNSQTNSMINGDLNLGVFVGFRFAFSDKAGLSIGGNLGPTSLSNNASTNTAITDNQTETLAGFNYGGAIVFDWQKKFQIGAVIGYDYGVGNLAKTYVYQQKSWFSISLNYKFLDFGKQENQSNATDKPKN